MKSLATMAAGVLTASILATSALSGGHADKGAMAAVKARQAAMQVYAFNIGILGKMAKGEVDYNADAASAAAGNLALLGQMNNMAMWVPGTDNETLGDTTEALPAIWQEGSKIGEAAMAFSTSTAALAEVAGDGLDALRGGIGAVGKSCGGCHDTYRAAN